MATFRIRGFGSDPNDLRPPNRAQAEYLQDSQSKLLHFSGGFGCVREDQLIETFKGLVPIGDINQSTFYKSWDGREFVWAQGTAAYPKGRANLYRVVHEHGEFVASGHHRVFSHLGDYRPVDALEVGDGLFSSLPCPLHSTSGPDLKLFPLGGQHSIGTGADYQGGYSAYSHQRDPRLLLGLVDGLVSSPSPGDAQGSPLSFGQYDPVELAPMRNRRGHRPGQICTDDSFRPSSGLAVGGTIHISESTSGRTLPNIQPGQQSLCSSVSRHTGNESVPGCTCSFASRVISIESLGVEWFWDLHVFGTNNYVMSNTVHHNSGKTTALMGKILKLSAANKGIDGGLVCQDMTEYSRDVYPALTQLLDINGVPYHENKGKKFFEFPWSTGKLWIVSAKKKIRGPNWGYAGINELTLIPLERYKEAIGRVRVKGAPCPQIASNGTPEGYDSPYYEYLIEKPNDKIRVIYGSTRENADNLEENYIETLIETFDAAMRAAFVDGQWVIMTSDRFYYNYGELNQDKSMEPNWNLPFHVSMDFNVDPMSAVMWQKYSDHDLRAVDEIILEGGSDTKKMGQAMIDHGYTPDVVTIYPDPSGNARSTKGMPDIQQLRGMGFDDIKVRSKAPGMRKRQLNANNLFEKGWVRVNPIRCPWMQKDLIGVKLDKTTMEKSKTNPKLTHTSDGMDYLFDHMFPFSGVKPQITSGDYR